MNKTPNHSIASDLKSLIEEFEQENTRLKIENAQLRQDNEALIIKTSMAREQIKQIIQRMKALKHSG